MKIIGVISLAFKVIFEVNHPRKPPTQFRKLEKYFKSEFPGNEIKLLVSPDSAWFPDSVPIIVIEGEFVKIREFTMGIMRLILRQT